MERVRRLCEHISPRPAQVWTFAGVLLLALVAGSLWTAAAAQANPVENQLPIDPLRVAADEQGDLIVSVGLELSPNGLESFVIDGDDVIAYTESTTQAAVVASARYIMSQSFSLSLAVRAGALHKRQVWDGGPEMRHVTALAPNIAGAGLHYQAPRSAAGRSIGVTLRKEGETMHVEASVSQIRDPLLLAGSVIYQANARSMGDRAVGLWGSVAFVANERVTLRGSTGVTIPLEGLKIPTSTLAWRTGYLVDLAGEQEVSLYGSWTHNGWRSWTKAGVEWTLKL